MGLSTRVVSEIGGEAPFESDVQMGVTRAGRI